MNRAEAYVNYFKTFYALADERCRRYWGTDRPNGQAAGLESLCRFAGIVASHAGFNMMKRSGHIETFDPDGEKLVVVDAGAGASSAILRTYFKNVISCDPDGEYLAQVRRACEKMGLGHGEWVSGIPGGEWDCCFYDYGTKERKPSFDEFLGKTRKLIWIDDAHDVDLRYWCAGVAAERGKNLYTIPSSIDEHGRYGAVVTVVPLGDIQ